MGAAALGRSKRVNVEVFAAANRQQQPAQSDQKRQQRSSMTAAAANAASSHLQRSAARRQKAENATVSAASSRLIESPRLQRAEGGRWRSGECISSQRDFRRQKAECIKVSEASSSLIESWSATARMQIEAARLQKSGGKRSRRRTVDQ